MIRKSRITYIFVLLSALILGASPSGAQVVLFDTFSDQSKLHPSSTVHWDASNQLVQLPMKTFPNALSLRENGDYVIANQGEISWYSYDSASNQMMKMNELSVSMSDPLGVTVKQDEYALWAFDGQDIKRYDFSGTGMIYNPMLSVTGLNGVLSVSSMDSEEAFSVLRKDSNNQGEVTLYRFDGSTMIPTTTFATGVLDPVSVTMVPGTSDFIVAGVNEYGYFQYDPVGNTYIRNPWLSMTGLQDVIVTSIQNSNEIKILKTNEIQHVGFDGNAMSNNPMLGVSPISNAISMSTNPSSYDFAYLNEAGEVQYYQFDGSSLLRNTALEITGVNIIKGYLKPKLYQSVLINTPKTRNLAKLTVTENNDSTGTIGYEISSDGGITWNSIAPNNWTQIPEGNQFTIRGTLDSTSPEATPRLLDIQLELTKLDLINPRVTHMIYPGPKQIDPFPDYSFPVYVKSGSEFTFKIDSDGYLDRVVAQFTNGDSVEMVPQLLVTNETNTWTGRYIPSLNTMDGTSEGVTFIGYQGALSFTLPIVSFYETDGNASSAVGVKLIQ